MDYLISRGAGIFRCDKFFLSFLHDIDKLFFRSGYFAVNLPSTGNFAVSSSHTECTRHPAKLTSKMAGVSKHFGNKLVQI